MDFGSIPNKDSGTTIQRRKPTSEFYYHLDVVVNHQVSSREAFNKAIEIGRKQGFTDSEIHAFIRTYLKPRIPKTSFYRYMQELVDGPLETEDEHLEILTVPLELYNDNSTELKEPIYYMEHSEIKDLEFHQLMNEAIKEMRAFEQKVLEYAKRLEELGCPKQNIGFNVLEKLKSKGCKEHGLDLAYDSLPNEYKDFGSQVAVEIVDFDKTHGDNIRKWAEALEDDIKQGKRPNLKVNMISTEIMAELKKRNIDTRFVNRVPKFLDSKYKKKKVTGNNDC